MAKQSYIQSNDRQTLSNSSQTIVRAKKPGPNNRLCCGELALKSLGISSRLTKSDNSPRWLLVVPEPAPDLGPYDGLVTAQPCSAAFYDRFTIASPLFHATAFVAASQLSSREFTTSVFLVNSPAYAVFARIYDRSAFLSRIFYTYSLFMFDMHLKGV